MAASLGETCRRARQDAGVRSIDIATTARVSEATISKFEHGVGWRRETDAIVAAYEHECGLPERALWRRAVER
jgi:transcriptional regulator with XRE-family HTH domain